MRKVDDGKRKKKRKKKKRKEKKRKKKRKEKKRMAFLMATTSLPAVYRPDGYARTTTAGTPHARAKRKYNTNTRGEMVQIASPDAVKLWRTSGAASTAPKH